MIRLHTAYSQTYHTSSSLINSELDAASGTSSSSSTATATKVSSQPSTSSHVEVPRSIPPSVAAAAASLPIKYQYYQSAECLNISILAKGLLPSEVIQFNLIYYAFDHLFMHIIYLLCLRHLCCVCTFIYQSIYLLLCIPL